MTLHEMVISAARYSDRYDEFEEYPDGDYQDDALLYFNIFRDAINEAYNAVSREYTMPDTYEQVEVEEDGLVDLTTLMPEIYGIKDVLNADRTMNLEYTFQTKYEIIVKGVNRGDTVTIYYHYIPDRLEELTDSPVFPESIVDPMIYISLAVARIWMSEKKFDYANPWLAQYQMMLRSIRSDLRNKIDRRIPRRMFR